MHLKMLATNLLKENILNKYAAHNNLKTITVTCTNI